MAVIAMSLGARIDRPQDAPPGRGRRVIDKLPNPFGIAGDDHLVASLSPQRIDRDQRRTVRLAVGQLRLDDDQTTPFQAFVLGRRVGRSEDAGGLQSDQAFVEGSSILRANPKRGLTLWRRVDILGFTASPERVRPLFGLALKSDRHQKPYRFAAPPTTFRSSTMLHRRSRVNVCGVVTPSPVGPAIENDR